MQMSAVEQLESPGFRIETATGYGKEGWRQRFKSDERIAFSAASMLPAAFARRLLR